MATADLQSQPSQGRSPIINDSPKSKLAILLPAFATMVELWGEHDRVIDTAKDALEQIDQTNNIDTSEDS